jgi:hypothetical protein
MSETPDASMPPAVPQSADVPPAYRVGPTYAAAPAAGIVPGPLMISGILLIVAFIAHLVTYLSPGLTIISALVEMAALIGAYVGYLRAGFPSRSGAARGLAVVLILLYLLAGSGGAAIGIGALPIEAFPALILLGVGVLIAGVAFGIVSLVTRDLPSPLKAAPIVMYGVAFLLGLISPALSGGGYLVAGVMYLLLAESGRRTSVTGV